jgi:hypothetical protein
MRRYFFCFVLLLAANLLMHGSPQQGQRGQRRQAETWYERAVRQINPSNTNYGLTWEHYKAEFKSRLRDPYFRYGFATMLAVIVLLTTLFAQHISRRRAIELAVQSIADIRRHDEYAREAAREAIRRYNDHIEKCNRMVEADESGLWKWISSAELQALNSKMRRMADELAAAREEVKSLKAELNDKSAVIAEMSLRAKGGPGSKHNVPAAHIERINQLELELNQEKKKNLRVKGTGLDVRDS